MFEKTKITKRDKASIATLPVRLPSIITACLITCVLLHLSGAACGMIVVCNVEITLPKEPPIESQAEPVVAALDTPVCFITCTCHLVRAAEKRNTVMEFFLIDFIS